MFTDPGAMSCSASDMGGIITVYVFHLWMPGASGSHFRIIQLNGANLTYLGESLPPPSAPYYFTSNGNSQIGIHIRYEEQGMLHACRVSPLHILTIEYIGSGISSNCSHLQVVGDPTPIAMDCMPAPMPWAATGGAVVINPDPNCMCNVPVEETTWGKVKALYQ